MKPDEIKKLRLKLLMAQAELAAKLGVSASLVYQWELGLRRPSKPCLILLGQLQDRLTAQARSRDKR